MHINYLELLVIFYGLKCFGRDVSHCSILVRVDNKTAVAYVNKMGGTRSKSLNLLSKQIWKWCEKRNIYLHALYIPSKDNIADKESRCISTKSEYFLNWHIYSEITSKFGIPVIDLFATKINATCNNYISWHPDSDAVGTDAFTVNWPGKFFYACPPLFPHIYNFVL